MTIGACASTSSTSPSARPRVRVVVGRIGRPHGIRGEVTVETRTDEPDERFAPGAVLSVDGPVSELVVERQHWHSGRLLVHFRGVEDRNAAEALRGLLLALHLHDRATVPNLSTAGDTAIFGTVPLGELAAGGAEVADLTMMACHNLVRELCGPGWRPREVQLARRAPAKKAAPRREKRDA